MAAGCFLLLPLFTLLALVSAQQRLCPQNVENAGCYCIERGAEIHVKCDDTDYHNIISALDHVYRRLSKIDELYITNSRFLMLPPRAFGSIAISRIFLINNQIETISRDAFFGLENTLDELHIEERTLYDLSPGALDMLRNLRIMIIQNTPIRELPLLEGFRALRYVRVDNTRVETVRPGTFRQLPSLRYLHVTNSMLSRLEGGTLDGLRQLAVANFSGNQIDWVHPDAILRADNLEELDLSNNKIHDVVAATRVLYRLPSLQTINLKKNNIMTLNADAFSELRIKSIGLQDNEITEIRRGAFFRLPYLRTIDLRGNMISEIEDGAFREVDSLAEMYLSKNKFWGLSEVEPILEGLPKLHLLDLSENLITEVPATSGRGSHPLKVLMLNSNLISRVEPGALSAMSGLQEIYLSNNQLTGDLEPFGRSLRSLRALDLSQNNLTAVRRDSFEDLPSLSQLDLSMNQINHLDDGAFSQLGNLQALNLSYNSLSTVESGALNGMRNVFDLDLSHNRLLTLEEGAFSDLVRLGILNLANNQIVTVSPKSFSTRNNLKILDVSNNFMKELPVEAFSILRSLKSFALKYNGLVLINSGSFSSLENLERLDLTGNNIQQIGGDVLDDLRSLRELILSENALQQIQRSALSNLRHLRMLSLRGNQISHLDIDTFVDLQDLVVLDISENSLGNVDDVISDLSSLKKLDLSHNYLSTVSNRTFRELPELQSVDLSNNDLHTISPGTFVNLWTLKKIDLQNNSLIELHPGTFSDLTNLQEIYLNNNKIALIRSRAFVDLYSLRYLHLHNNLITKIEDSSFENLPVLKKLNISHNNIRALPRDGFYRVPTLEVIDLSFNHIQEVDDGLRQMLLLKQIMLHDNAICRVSPSAFRQQRQLRTLDLRNNKLRHLEEEAMGPVKGTLQEIKVDGNPLVCDCHMTWLKDWMTQPGHSLQEDAPLCYFPHEIRGNDILRLSESDFKCSRSLERLREECDSPFPPDEIYQDNPDRFQQHSGTQVVSTILEIQNSTSKPVVDDSNPIDSSPSNYYEYYYYYYEDGSGASTEDSALEAVPDSVASGDNSVDVKVVSGTTTTSPRLQVDTAPVLGPATEAIKSSDYTPGDTPTMYAGLRKNGSSEPSENPKQTEAGGLTLFGIPIPDLNLGLTLDMVPNLNLGRKGEDKKYDDRRGPPRKPFRGPDTGRPMWAPNNNYPRPGNGLGDPRVPLRLPMPPPDGTVKYAAHLPAHPAAPGNQDHFTPTPIPISAATAQSPPLINPPPPPEYGHTIMSASGSVPSVFLTPPPRRGPPTILPGARPILNLPGGPFLRPTRRPLPPSRVSFPQNPHDRPPIMTPPPRQPEVSMVPFHEEVHLPDSDEEMMSGFHPSNFAPTLAQEEDLLFTTIRPDEHQEDSSPPSRIVLPSGHELGDLPNFRFPTTTEPAPTNAVFTEDPGLDSVEVIHRGTPATTDSPGYDETTTLQDDGSYGHVIDDDYPGDIYEEYYEEYEYVNATEEETGEEQEESSNTFSLSDLFGIWTGSMNDKDENPQSPPPQRGESTYGSRVTTESPHSMFGIRIPRPPSSTRQPNIVIQDLGSKHEHNFTDYDYPATYETTTYFPNVYDIDYSEEEEEEQQRLEDIPSMKDVFPDLHVPLVPIPTPPTDKQSEPPYPFYPDRPYSNTNSVDEDEASSTDWYYRNYHNNNNLNPYVGPGADRIKNGARRSSVAVVTVLVGGLVTAVSRHGLC